MKKVLTSLLALAAMACTAVAAVAAPVVETARTFVVAAAEKAHDALFAYMVKSGAVLGMAEFNSRQKTSLASTPKVKAQPCDHGKISVQVATTPAVAAWAQNDTWGTGIRIPKGSRILRSGRLSHGIFGASTTMHVGIRNADTLAVVDVDGLAASLDVAAAGVKELDGGSLFAAGVAYTTVEDVEIYATLLAANPTDNAQAELEIHYLAATP